MRALAGCAVLDLGKQDDGHDAHQQAPGLRLAQGPAQHEVGDQRHEDADDPEDGRDQRGPAAGDAGVEGGEGNGIEHAAGNAGTKNDVGRAVPKGPARPGNR
ncbi:MAG: hypothetical protein KDK12_14480 [Rhodobacteraceae bacterium]|nr:hypothetical protein [Paracoccaceae bacterium]